MSQRASTHLIIPEPSEELLCSEAWTIETYADGLMDELFADIDQFLDGNELSTQTVLAKHIPLQTVQVSPIVLANAYGSILPGSYQADGHQLSRVVTPNLKKRVKKRSIKQKVGILGRIFSLIAIFGLANAGMVSLLNSGIFNRLGNSSYQQVINKNPTQAKPVQLTKAQVESDFASYILGALAVIEPQEARNLQSSRRLIASQSNINRTALSYFSERPNGDLAPPRTAENTVPSASQTVGVVERIYIPPTYQAPLPMRYAPKTVLALGNTQSPATNVPQSVPSSRSKTNSTEKVIAPVQKNLKPVKVQTSPITLKQPQQTVPKPLASPKKPQTKLITPTQTNPTASQLASVTVGSAAHILEGLLELGEKSAALFKINGVTQRIEIGESIGSSGWTLVDVEKGKAVIRRNGEVRSILTGQKF
ncbi:unknown protein [Richelia intracellularis]|nr:unknown protein [Richelia intracellularis]